MGTATRLRRWGVVDEWELTMPLMAGARSPGPVEVEQARMPLALARHSEKRVQH